MKSILEWFEGKKTYITAAVTFVLGGLQALGVEVPAWLYAVLASLGITFLRSGVEKTGS
ncbi:MAG: hypothetical protein ABFD92_16920 [Planctomycetaceae bacterium]|nr:hypothetical protein [Planctomycetaceae bacterium]